MGWNILHFAETTLPLSGPSQMPLHDPQRTRGEGAGGRPTPSLQPVVHWVRELQA